MTRYQTVLFHPIRTQLLIFSLVAMLMSPVRAEESESSPESFEDAPTFKLELVEKKFLPPAMYGTWSIHCTVLRSDAPPWLFSTSTQELWALSRDGDTIVLHNVVTNATAQVTVDEVYGNTATFHHEAGSRSNRLHVIETPTVTVDGDRLHGLNVQKITMKQLIGPPRTYTLEVALEGSRLSGARVRFDGYDRPDPDFVVEPLRQEE